MFKDSMRIAVVAADILPDRLGGAEHHLFEVLKRLGKRGYKFELFVGEDSAIQKLLPSSIRVHPVLYPKITNFHGLSYIAFAPKQIFKKLNGSDIDILWAKQVFPQAVVGAILARRLGKPLYVTAQNPMAYKEELVIKGPIPGKRLLPNLLTPLVKFALRSASTVAAVSTYSEKKAKELGAKKTTVVPNGVDLTKFKIPNDKFRMGKRKKIVSTSALIPRNGLDTLIDAVSLLPRRLDWELVIAGEGPEEQNLKVQMKKCKLEKKIQLIGRVGNQDIPKFLRSADLFVRLSRKEGFGVSFLEAMAAGVPVLATNVGGIPGFIKDGTTGLLVSPDDPKKASVAIARLLKNSELREKLKRNGRSLVEKRYNWDRIADEVFQTFQELS